MMTGCRAWAWAAIVVLITRTIAAEDVERDFLMLSDPAFDVVKPSVKLPEGSIALWKKTLSAAEPDLIKAAADSIAVAHRKGFDGLTGCADDLLATLENPDLPRASAFAVCRALIELDAAEAADELFVLSGQGGEFRQLIEPALANWDYLPVREVWRTRLADSLAPRRELLLACSGAGTVQDAEALPLLIEIVGSKARPGDARLAAARAAGQIASAALEAEAVTLLELSPQNLLNDLCAFALIAAHTSPAAQKIFLSMAVHENPTIAAPALRALLEIDPQLVLPLAEQSLQNADAKVRQGGLDAYIALPTVERIPLIADVMDDPHPDVRASARRALERLSDEESFDRPVREAALTMLNRDSWRCQQQAALLAAVLDHEPAAARLVELLESDRVEVMTTAAWTLRKLAVAETADGILDRAGRVTEHVLTTPLQDRQPGSDEQLAHLFEALAVLDDARAIDVMRKHVPKDVFREKARAAAIWALGRLLEDRPDPALARELMLRLTDIQTDPPELDLVRQMSAISIGRMNAVQLTDRLESFLGDQLVVSSPIELAMAWSIRRMHGDVPPEILPPPTIIFGWPLEPISPGFGE